MSYDISLVDPVTHETLEFDEPHQMRGGTYAIGGTTTAWLNVTYNYSDYYYDVMSEGIRTIYGKSGAESIPILDKAVQDIKDKYMCDGRWKEGEGENKDYWEPTAANAVKPLLQLRAMAVMRPDGVWEGD